MVLPVSILLVVIFITFISLGLPDAILGAAWPEMRSDFSLSIGYAGVIAAITCAATICSSLLSGRLVAWIGIGRLIFLSCLLTASALIAYSMTSSFYMLLMITLPLGFGGGAIDAAVNNYVSIHYRSGHLNMLHGFWGVGAMTGPLVVAYNLGNGHGWQISYLTLGLFQAIIAMALLFKIKAWSSSSISTHDADALTHDKSQSRSGAANPYKGNRDALKLQGVPAQMLASFSYCALEITMGLWISSFLVMLFDLTIANAAFWVAIFYMGITGGRFLSGFIADYFDGLVLARIGIMILCCGLGAIILNKNLSLIQIGIVLTGLGCAPIFPAILKQTPLRFGQDYSQTIMGLSMASAYFSITITPLLIGWIASQTTLTILPQILVFFGAVLLASMESLNKTKPSS